MRQLGELLRPVGQVHLLDLPGFGESEAPSATWSTYDYASAVGEYLDSKGIAEALCVGHSFGGKVALCLAITRPSSVAGLGLIAASGIRSALPLRQRMRAAALRVAGRGVRLWDRFTGRDAFETWFVPRVGSKDYQQAGSLRNILVRTVNDDLSNDLHKVCCPTLLLWGDKDTDTPVAVARTMRDKMTNCELLLFPQKGHHLLHDVSSHLLAYYLRPFLESKSMPGSTPVVSGRSLGLGRHTC